jgi:CheY-like chemotaxis protein
LLDHEIAVILLDVQMPEIDGFALAQLIREHPRYKTRLYLYLSGTPDPRDQLRATTMARWITSRCPSCPSCYGAKVRVFVEHYRVGERWRTRNATPNGTASSPCSDAWQRGCRMKSAIPWRHWRCI